MTPGTLIGLILCNVIWSLHPVMGKLVLEDFAPIEGAWIRYTSAFLTFVILLILWPAIARFSRGRLDADRSRSFIPRGTRRDLLWVAAAGLLVFCFSPLLQMSGLEKSRATDNAIIIAIEPLVTVVLARLLLGERLKAYHWVAFGLATSGFALLTGLTWTQLGGVWDAHLFGNFIMLISLLGEASYTVLGRKLAGRVKPAAIFTGAIVVGPLMLTVAAIVLGQLPDLSNFTSRSALGILWLGPLGTTMTYFYWMHALARVPVTSLAITLFVQPLLGSIWGGVFMDDRLSMLQWTGAILILLGVFSQVRAELRPAAAGNAAQLNEI